MKFKPANGNYRLREGLLIDGYGLVRKLGAGFSSEVWQAQVREQIDGLPLSVGDYVALKIYTIPLSQNSQTLRIQQEYNVASTIEHPNLIKVYDLVISPNRPLNSFLAMEFAEGLTLKEFKRYPEMSMLISPEEIAVQLLEAAGVLHRQGVFHRDIKPSNIIVLTNRERPIVKLVDLGIIEIVDEPSLTFLSNFLGSKHYASLEQLTGKEIDGRADIYSIAATMYYVITGREPYEGAGPEGAIVQEMLSNPLKLTDEVLMSLDYLQETSASLFEFISSGLSIKREERPSSAEEALQSFFVENRRNRNNLDLEEMESVRVRRK